MNIVEQSHTILTFLAYGDVYRAIECAGRTAYKSEDKITNSSAVTFIRHIMTLRHESVLEHVNISVRFVTDRGVTHELVRHRLCAYTQESTRYCNYYKKGMQVIKPVFWKDSEDNYAYWSNAMLYAETMYNELIKNGAKPEQARSVLPNSLKTEIICTTNICEWRHILKLRTSQTAHPQMRALMIPLLRELQEMLPALFSDIEVKE